MSEKTFTFDVGGIYAPRQTWNREQLMVLRVKARLLGFAVLYFDASPLDEGPEYVTWGLDGEPPAVLLAGEWYATDSDIPF